MPTLSIETLGPETLQAIDLGFKYLANNPSLWSFKVSRAKKHDPEKTLTPQTHVVLEGVVPQHNLLFKRCDDGSRVCVVLDELLGHGGYSKVFDSLKIIETKENERVVSTSVTKILLRGGVSITWRLLKFLLTAESYAKLEALPEEEAKKTIKSELMAYGLNRSSQQKVNREVSVGKALNLVHEVIELPNQKSYIVMEKRRGMTLFNALKNRQYTDQQKYAILPKLLKALIEFHGKGYTHGDLKPENVFIDDEFNISFIDFDSACKIDGEERCSGGTYGYHAPEKKGYGYLNAQAVAADLYSLGCIFIDVLTPYIVFYDDDNLLHQMEIMLKQDRNKDLVFNKADQTNTSMFEIFSAEIKIKYPLITASWDEIPISIVSVLGSLTQFNPKNRITADVALALLGTEPVAAPALAVRKHRL